MRKTISRSIYDFTAKRIVLTTAAASLPSLWFTIISIYGKQAGFYTSDGMTLHNWILSFFWIGIGISATFTLLRAIGDKYNTVAKSNGIAVFSKLMHSANASKSSQYDKLSRLIREGNGDQFCQRMSPAERINFIIDSFQKSFADIFGLKIAEIGLSVLYHFSNVGRWRLIRTNNLENDLSVDELTTNDHTTAMSIFRLNKATIFHPDKRSGRTKGCYVYGPKDLERNSIGSVLCHDISLYDESRYVTAVLSITTYGNQLCEEDDLEAKDKITNLLVPMLENRIKVELAIMYISDQKRCVAVS